MVTVSGRDGDLARDAIRLLSGAATGLVLLGPRRRTDRIIDLVCDRLDPAVLSPVRFDADVLSPEQLRDAVHRAHSARLSRDTVLLLVLSDTAHLPPAVMRDLEMAADAAGTFGGLRFLLAGTEPFGPALRAAGLAALDKALAGSLVVPPDPTETPAAAPAPARAPLLRPAAPSRRTTAIRVLLASAIVVLLVLIVILASRTPRTGSPAPVVTPPATLSVPPPPSVRSQGPAIVSPAPLAPPPERAPPPAPLDPPSPVVGPPAQAGGDAPMGNTPSAATPRATSLLLMAQPGDTLERLYAKVYAGAAAPPFEEVRRLNPVVQPGARLVFPPPPNGWPSR